MPILGLEQSQGVLVTSSLYFALQGTTRPRSWVHILLQQRLHCALEVSYGSLRSVSVALGPHLSWSFGLRLGHRGTGGLLTGCSPGAQGMTGGALDGSLTRGGLCPQPWHAL